MFATIGSRPAATPASSWLQETFAAHNADDVNRKFQEAPHGYQSS
jgi:hypothetical protein